MLGGVRWFRWGIRGLGWDILRLGGRAGIVRSRVPGTCCSPRSVLAGGVLQLGGHGGGHLRVVGLHRLGQVLSTGVETWDRYKY